MSMTMPSNLAKIKKALELHSGRYTSVSYADPPGVPTETVRCQQCYHEAPCPTERVLKGDFS